MFESYFHILFLLITSDEYEFDREALLKFGMENRNMLHFRCCFSYIAIGLISKHMLINDAHLTLVN